MCVGALFDVLDCPRRFLKPDEIQVELQYIINHRKNCMT